MNSEAEFICSAIDDAICSDSYCNIHYEPLHQPAGVFRIKPTALYESRLGSYVDAYLLNGGKWQFVKLSVDRIKSVKRIPESMVLTPVEIREVRG